MWKSLEQALARNVRERIEVSKAVPSSVPAPAAAAATPVMTSSATAAASSSSSSSGARSAASSRGAPSARGAAETDNNDRQPFLKESSLTQCLHTGIKQISLIKTEEEAKLKAENEACFGICER